MFGVGFVLLTFGVAQLLGGSGFLAVYVAGIIIGNRPFTYRRNLIRFHDSLAWIAQVGMFLLLGLLVNPRELPSVMPMGLLAAFFLIFFSRPAAVFICLWRSRFGWKEKLFVGWAGLKGAVPIILATYPLMIGFPDSQYLFNLISFLSSVRCFCRAKRFPGWLPAGSLPEMKKRSAARTERQTFRPVVDWGSRLFEWQKI